MKLEWLAAVLRPDDIAPHPNFRNPNYDSRPHVVLAGAVLGNISARPSIFPEDRPTEVYDSREASAVQLAIKTFFLETQRDAATELVERLLSDDLDVAAICALSLFTATALAELEDRQLFEQLLTSVLDRVTASDPANALLRVVLLQQLGLRRQDWGSSDTILSQEANQLIDSIKDAEFPVFETNPSCVGGSSTTVRHIITALQYSIWSLLPNSMSLASPSGPVIEWKEILTSPDSEEILLIHRAKANEYARFVRDSFNRQYGDRSQYFGRSPSDLFFVNLRHELYGSASVYQTRKEIALMRLVEADSTSAGHDLAECLRLLRYGKGDEFLSLAVERLRLGGPLLSLSQDARQAIARRLTPGFVRTEDLQVVRAAADLLTESEAKDALAAVFRLIDAGSKIKDPERWSAPTSRLERAWRAAASLAGPANSVVEVSSRLLRDLRSADYDIALDMAYARVLLDLEWDNSFGPHSHEWRAWLDSPGEWNYTAATARSKLKLRSTTDETVVESVTHVEAVVSDLLSEHAVSDTIKSNSADVVIRAMSSISTAAQKLQYAWSGSHPSELAVVLIQFGEERLWQPLVEFLADAVVPRQYKTRALDRLADSASTLTVPQDVMDILRERTELLLLTPDPNPMGSDLLRPHPAALRMLASYGLVSDDELILWLSGLIGSRLPHARMEASKTVAVLSSQRGNPQLLTMALQLSYETDADVQGYASNAMAAMVGVPSPAQEAAIQRLLALMQSDSLIAPLLAIRGLAKEPGMIDSRLWFSVERLVSRHPSRQVRAEAAALVQRSVEPT